MGLRSEDELHAAVETLLDDAEYHRLQDALQPGVSFRTLVEVALGFGPPEWLLVLAAGSTLAKKAEAADRLLRLQAKAVLGFFNAVSSTPEPDLAAALSVKREPLWFLVDPRLPSSVREALLARERVTVYFLALYLSPAEPTVVEWLLDRLIDDQRVYLGLLAEMPGVTIPDGVVPEAMRISPDAMDEGHRAAEDAYRARLAYARRQGSSVAFGDDHTR